MVQMQRLQSLGQSIKIEPGSVPISKSNSLLTAGSSLPPTGRTTFSVPKLFSNVLAANSSAQASTTQDDSLIRPGPSEPMDDEFVDIEENSDDEDEDDDIEDITDSPSEEINHQTQKQSHSV